MVLTSHTIQKLDQKANGYGKANGFATYEYRTWISLVSKLFQMASI
jgi:hypothetical protein